MQVQNCLTSTKKNNNNNSKARLTLVGASGMQSTFSKRNIFGARTECPSSKQSNKGIRERKGPTVDVRFTEIPLLQKFPLRQSRLYHLSYHEDSTLRSEPPFVFLIEEEKRRPCLKRVKPLRSPQPFVFYCLTRCQ